jgi:hypothetical protein
VLRIKLFTFLLFFSISSSAKSSSFFDSLNKKSSGKNASKWTIADWLETKKKVQVMDHWLAVNSSINIFEFYLGVSHFDFTDQLFDLGEPGIKSKDELSTITLAGFLTILGLKIQNEIDDSMDTTSMEVLLRVFGKSEQSSRWNLFYGTNFIKDDFYLESYKRVFYGSEVRIYIFKFLSMDGRYVFFEPSEVPDNSIKKGTLVEYGLNFDLGAFQLFGKYVDQTNDLTLSSKMIRNGIRYGVNFYF